MNIYIHLIIIVNKKRIDMFVMAESMIMIQRYKMTNYLIACGVKQ